MTELKKIFVFPIFFLFFLSCGYTPIFSKKDVNFSIENIKYFGDKDVKEKINPTLYKSMLAGSACIFLIKSKISINDKVPVNP